MTGVCACAWASWRASRRAERPCSFWVSVAASLAAAVGRRTALGHPCDAFCGSRAGNDVARAPAAYAGKTLACAAFFADAIDGTVSRVGCADVEPLAGLGFENERGASESEVEEAGEGGGVGVGEDDG